jgi:hypothetical protein
LINDRIFDAGEFEPGQASRQNLSGLETLDDTRSRDRRHRSVDTLRGYIRDNEIFKDHAGAGLL